MIVMIAYKGTVRIVTWVYKCHRIAICIKEAYYMIVNSDFL